MVGGAKLEDRAIIERIKSSKDLLHVHHYHSSHTYEATILRNDVSDALVVNHGECAEFLLAAGERVIVGGST